MYKYQLEEKVYSLEEEIRMLKGEIPQKEREITSNNMITIPQQMIKVYTGVYFLWYKGTIVYIGRSNNITARLATHNSSPDTLITYSCFDKVTYIIEENFKRMTLLETICIRHFKPLHNRTSSKKENTIEEEKILQYHNLIKTKE